MNALRKVISSQQYSRNISNVIKISSCSYATDEKWMSAIKNAEKVVGYPASFMNLRWLLADEISDIASYVPKLVGSKHPMLRIARDVIQQNDTAKWGLILLLVSKAAGIRPEIEQDQQDGSSGILHTQRSLAEITEMIKTGHQMHDSLVNVNESDKNYQNLHFGNKLALLSGDYLYSKSFKDLSQLNNNELNEIIATSLRDMAHINFITPRNQFDEPLPSKPKSNENVEQISHQDIDPYNVSKFLGSPREEWIIRNILGGVTLLAKSCKGVIMLGKHPVELQQKGFHLGCSLGLAWQAYQELKPFIQDSVLPFSLTSAPVLFQLKHEPDMYELFEAGSKGYKEIRNKVLMGNGISEALDLLKELREDGINILDSFPTNKANQCLIDLINALKP